MEVKEFKDLSREELKNMLICMISGHECENEICNLLATFAAYNIEIPVGENYDYSELSTDEVIERIATSMSGDWESEDGAWNAVLDSIGPDKAFDIIHNFSDYMVRHITFKHHLKDIEHEWLKLFTSK